MEFFVASLLCLLFMCVFNHLTKTKASSGKLPPGPRRIPILGNLLDLGDKPHKSLAALARIHGPIMSLKLGNLITIVLSSPATAKEVLQTNDLIFSNRTVVDASRANNHHEMVMPWLPISPLWRNLRKVYNVHIFARHRHDATQSLCQTKIGELIATVRESCRLGDDVVVNIGQEVFNTTLNILSNIMFSVDLADSNSPRSQEFKKIVWCIMEELGSPNLADFYPLLRRLDPQGIRRRMRIHTDKLIEIVEEIYDARVQLRKKGWSAANDVLDALIDIVDDENHDLGRDHIMLLFLDLFVAGTDTTSSTVEWAMAELLRNPKVLLKAQAELDEAIGRGKLVEETDMASLPYLSAIVKETFRLHPPTPLLIPRRADADVEICGFIVPEGAQVFVNAWAIGRDPSIWEMPSIFMPERFVGSEIDVKGRHFELIPFGGGRRICPGMNSSLRVLPLILGSLINCFEWKLEDGVTPENLNMDEKFGIAIQRVQPLLAIPTLVC